ncbi:MAG: TIGR02302 family protein [Xanthobacteraceae bacterium]
MNGAKPDPSMPAGEPDDVARLKLTQALQRATYAIAWERAWPHLARLLTLAGFFLTVSWAGLWLSLPFAARAAGLFVFAVAGVVVLWPLIRFRWPTRSEALGRLDRGTGIRHRPATALSDTVTTTDPVALALWQENRARTLAGLTRIRAGLPSPRLAIHDPWAVRGLVAVMMVAAYVAAGDERNLRVASAFDWNGVLAPANIRVDAWVTPPVYTGRPPIILSSANKESAAAGPLPVPAGSTVIVRSSGGTLDVVTGGGVTEAAQTEQAPKGTNERHFTVSGDGTVQVRSPSGQPQWKFTATPDRPPTIALAKDPERQPRGSLQMSYKIEDDYGVTEARAQFSARPGESAKEGAAASRPLFEPPQFSLVLPNARTRNGVGQTLKDLSEDPYAGADVTLTLTAKDEAGNSGQSEPFNMRLPQRLFSKPLARALIEQRRILALDANQNDKVHAALDALMIAPELFTPQAGHYLGLYSVARELEAARSDDDKLRAVVASLWALAVTIEDGDISDVEKALRAAEEALRQALERGASDEEIKKLTENLRAALDKYLRQLAEQLRNNPQQLSRPLDPNTKMLTQRDLDSMLKEIEREARRGNREAAMEALKRLGDIMRELRMAQPGQGGDDDMQQALNELGDMIRKQQQLRDKTFKQGQDSRRDRMRGNQDGDQNMGDLQQDQQALRDRLRKLQQELAKRGMSPGQRGDRGQRGDQQGQQGQGGEQGDGEDGLDQADSAMGDATGRLGEGNADGAVDSQGRALDALRKGAQSLAEAMQQGEGDGQMDGSQGPGNRAGRQQSGGNQTDPLGRPLHGREFNDDYTVKIPGEIDVERVRRILEELRRRLADPNRPQIELDYIERLLKDY